jgi:hypothetical protein
MSHWMNSSYLLSDFESYDPGKIHCLLSYATNNLLAECQCPNVTRRCYHHHIRYVKIIILMVRYIYALPNRYLRSPDDTLDGNLCSWSSYDGASSSSATFPSRPEARLIPNPLTPSPSISIISSSPRSEQSGKLSTILYQNFANP